MWCGGRWQSLGSPLRRLMGGEVGQMSAAHRGKTEKVKDIPKCVDCTHEEASTGRGAAAASTGERDGREGRGTRYEERTSSDGSPLCVNTSTKQPSLSKRPILLWERWIGARFSQPRRRPQPYQHTTDSPQCAQGYRKRQVKAPWTPCNHEAFHRRI